MTESKDGNQKTRIPYEPPTLFDLGGSVAHAKGKGDRCKNGSNPAGLVCKAGGSPGGGAECKPGTVAGSECKAGYTAGSECKLGQAASGGECKAGGMAAGGECKDGSAAAKCKTGGNTGKK